MPIETRLCADSTCNREYDVLMHNHETIGLDDRVDHPNCPRCSKHTYRKVAKVPLGIELGGPASAGRHYPYYDRNLCMHIDSAKHRKQVCKANGLVPAETMIDQTSDASSRAVRRDKDKAKLHELDDMYQNSPDFREYREASDKGVFDEQKLNDTAKEI